MDIGSKLKMIKNGRIESKVSSNHFSIFFDKNHSTIRNEINYKKVFKIWATQIYMVEKPKLSSQELQDIFPEFKHRIQLYDECCDGTGKIVRNFQAYNSYKHKIHETGKRGGVKVNER